MSEVLKKMESTGDTVGLRVFQKSDISDTYTSWLNDAEVVKYSKQRFLDHTIESCNNYMKSFSDTDNMYLAIEDKVTKRVVWINNCIYTSQLSHCRYWDDCWK